MPLYQEMFSSDEGLGLSKTSMLIRQVQRWKQHADEEVVVLLRILRHPINEGIDVAASDLRVVTLVNDVAIRSLEGLVCRSLEAICSGSHAATPQYLRYTFDVDDCLGISGVSSSEVLPIQGLLEADGCILAQNGIAAPVSPDLRAAYIQNAPGDHEHVATWLECLSALGRKCTPNKRARASVA